LLFGLCTLRENRFSSHESDKGEENVCFAERDSKVEVEAKLELKRRAIRWSFSQCNKLLVLSVQLIFGDKFSLSHLNIEKKFHRFTPKPLSVRRNKSESKELHRLCL
jgi:hypothetical protein